MRKIETARLIVREFEPGDGPRLHEIFGDPEVMLNCERAYTPEKTEEFLRSFCIGRRGALAAVLKESGRLIGYILCNAVEDGVFELGWIFNRAYWRQGYAYEACSAVRDHVFGELGAHKIFAEAIDPVKSVGLMEKLGMAREGVQRSHTSDDNRGGWADMYLYGMLEEDWRRVHGEQ